MLRALILDAIQLIGKYAITNEANYTEDVCLASKAQLEEAAIDLKRRMAK